MEEERENPAGLQNPNAELPDKELPDTELPDRELIEAAIAVLDKSYAPYSRYHVAAALRGGSGAIYLGVNVENASYPEGSCAETGAIAAMVLAGERSLTAIAVAGRGDTLITPCGGCRQRLREFGRAEIPVYACDHKGWRQSFRLGDLLPYAFTPAHLQ